MRISDWSSDVCSSDLGGTCTGPDQCALRVREWAKRGSDVIKITSTGGVLSQQGRGLEGHFDPAETRAITSTAHRLGLKVTAPAPGARSSAQRRLGSEGVAKCESRWSSITSQKK